MQNSYRIVSCNNRCQLKSAETSNFYTKYILPMNEPNSNQRLAVLNLDSLYVRRIKADLLLCYQMINNLVDVDVSAFFTLSVNLLEAMGVN